MVVAVLGITAKARLWLSLYATSAQDIAAVTLRIITGSPLTLYIKTTNKLLTSAARADDTSGRIGAQIIT